MITSAAFSADSALVVTACADATAKVWRAADGRAVSILSGHEDMVVNAIFSPDGRRVLTVSADGAARVWDWVGGRLLQTFRGRQAALTSGTFNQDGSLVLTTSSDGAARIWSVHRLTQGRSSLVADACQVLLGPSHGRFTPQEIDADPLLRATWPNPDQNICLPA
jgi:WD40 repeat protein